MALPTSLQRSRSAVVYLKAETTAGQIADAPVAGDAFGLTTVPAIAQAGNYTDTSEIGSELISVDRVLNYMDYSTFDLEFYAKPKGINTESTLSVTGISINDGTDTATVTMGETGTIAVGDTVTIAGCTGVTALNGDHVVVTVSNDTNFTFTTTESGSVGGTITATKKSLNTPPEDVILQRLFGGVKYNSRTVYTAGDASGSGATSDGKQVISYYLKNSINTLTVHSLQETDTTVQYFVGKGALATSFSLALAKDGPVTMSCGFQSSKVLYAGTAEIAGSGLTGHSSAVDATLQGTKRYASQSAVTASDVMWYEATEDQGTPVKIVSNDGATVKKTGLEIGAAPSGAVVSLHGDSTSPASAYATGDLLIPDLPDPSCDTTTTLDQRSVQVFMADETTGEKLGYSGQTTALADNTHLFHADNAIDVTACSIDFDRSITTPGLTEMTGSEFPPASYVINEPTITGSISLLLRPKDFQFMASLRDEPKRSVGFKVGTTDGKIIEVAIASAHFEVPTAAEADGATSLDLSFTVVRGQECNDSEKFILRYR